MTITETVSGKKFILERLVYVLFLNGVSYYKTASGNIVAQQPDKSWREIPMATVEANILLLPYAVAAEMFPDHPALIETI